MGRKVSLVQEWFEHNRVFMWGIFGITILFFLFLHMQYGRVDDDDLHLYFRSAQQWFSGNIPFKNFTIEYPPAALWMMAMPFIAGKTFLSYRLAFSIFVLLFLIAGAVLVYSQKRSPGLLIYTFLVLLIPSELVFQRLDLIVSVLCLAGLVAFQQQRTGLSAILLGISIGIKFYPIIFLPILLILLPDWKKRLHFCLILFGTILFIYVSFLVLGAEWQQFYYFLEYHQKRQIEIGSLWSSLAFLLRPFGEQVTAYGGFGAQNTGSQHTPLFAQLAMYCTVGSLLAFYAYVRQTLWNKQNTLPILVFATTCIFILFNKVFSPQYLLWLILLVPWILSSFSKKRKIMFFSLFLTIILLTYLIFPVFFTDLYQLREHAILLLIARNILFFIFTVFIVYHVYVLGTKQKHVVGSHSK